MIFRHISCQSSYVNLSRSGSGASFLPYSCSKPNQSYYRQQQLITSTTHPVKLLCPNLLSLRGDLDLDFPFGLLVLRRAGGDEAFGDLPLLGGDFDEALRGETLLGGGDLEDFARSLSRSLSRSLFSTTGSAGFGDL
jgi:hypothetical protein